MCLMSGEHYFGLSLGHNHSHSNAKSGTMSKDDGQNLNQD